MAQGYQQVEARKPKGAERQPELAKDSPGHPDLWPLFKSFPPPTPTHSQGTLKPLTKSAADGSSPTKCWSEERVLK